jgi:hypothetical protein
MHAIGLVYAFLFPVVLLGFLVGYGIYRIRSAQVTSVRVGIAFLVTWLVVGLAVLGWTGPTDTSGPGIAVPFVGSVILTLVSLTLLQSTVQGSTLGDVATAGQALRPCPFCAEQVRAAAVVCRFCNREIAPLVSVEQVERQRQAVDDCVQRLARLGYRVLPRTGGWEIREPLGGRLRVSTADELIEYAKDKGGEPQ